MRKVWRFFWSRFRIFDVGFNTFNTIFCHVLIISRVLNDFRRILDMEKRLSLLVTLKMNHRSVISFQFLLITHRHFLTHLWCCQQRDIFLRNTKFALLESAARIDRIDISH